MGKYDEEVALAEELLTEFGEKSKLVRTVPGTPSDPNKPWEPGAPAVTTIPVSAVWLNESIMRRESLAKEDESFAILSATKLKFVDPATDHLVRADKSRFSIIKAEPLEPDGQKIIFECTVRS